MERSASPALSGREHSEAWERGRILENYADITDSLFLNSLPLGPVSSVGYSVQQFGNQVWMELEQLAKDLDWSKVCVLLN